MDCWKCNKDCGKKCPYLGTCCGKGKMNLEESAWKLTMFQKGVVKDYDLRLRSFLLIFSSVLFFSLFRGYKKVPLTVGYFFLGSNVFTPELMNPYHNHNFFSLVETGNFGSNLRKFNMDK